MRILTVAALAIALMVSAVACGEKKEGPDAFAAMEKNKMVRIATDAVNLPFEFGEGTGVQGLDVDLGAEVAKDLGRDVKWVKAPFEKLFDLLKNGEVEIVISAISITPERRKELAFSESYFDSGQTVAIRKDREDIKGMSGLSGKKVGVQSSSTGQKYVETQKLASGVTIVKYPTLDDALGGLNRGEVEGVVGDEPILTYSIYKSFQNLMTLGFTLTEEKYAVVVRKNETKLLETINNTVSRLKKSGQLDELRKKWFQDVIQKAGDQRKLRDDEQKAKLAPKDVTFNFVKTGGAFNMDRLDGYTVILVGAQQYKSNPILTDGNRGSCKLTQVPPGEYRLSIPIFRLNTTIKVPNKAKNAIVFDMNIGSTGIAINER